MWLSTWQGAGDIPAEAYLFRSRQGENRAISRVQAWRILQSLYAANGLTGRLGTHSMRKTFAKKISTVLDGDLVKTQRALGHRHINSTVHSLSVREAEIDAAILAC